MKENELLKENSKSVSKDIFIVLALFVASLISVYGIYNSFGIGDIYHLVMSIEKPSEKYANIAMGIIFGVTMIILQGVNFKRKTIFEKFIFLLGIAFLTALIIGILFFFTSSILYPLIVMIVIGISVYLFDLVFMTLGVKGFFFFTVIFSLIIVGLFKMGLNSGSTILFLSQLALSFILFIAATYARIKQIVLKIGTRDNIDISNTGSNDDSDDNNSNDDND